jgi:hypothetical protein
MKASIYLSRAEIARKPPQRNAEVRGKFLLRLSLACTIPICQKTWVCESGKNERWRFFDK